MSNEIDNILKKAQLAYDNREYKQAIKMLENVYLSHKNFHNNYLLFKSFVNTHQWGLAVNVANDFWLDYVQNDTYFFQFFECLLRSGNILGGFILFDKIKPYLNSVEKDYLKQNLEHYLDYLSKEQQQRKKEILQSLKYLGGYSIHKQRYVLKNLKLLSPDELLQNSKRALLDSDVPCIVRMSIVDTLRKITHENVRVLNLFLEPVEINLGKILSIDEMQIFTKIKSRILNSCKIAETLKPKLIHEVKLKLIVMYSEISKLDKETIFEIVFNKDGESHELRKFRDAISREIKKVNDFKNY